MDDYDYDLIRVLLAQIVEDMGGIVKLDAGKILEKARNNEFKQIALRIKGEVAIVEIVDEDEYKAAE